MRDLRGFYDKFQVIRRETGEEVKEATFTLIPAHDPIARDALGCYADFCESENPDLAADLRALLSQWTP